MYDVSLKRKWDAEAIRQYQEQQLQEAIAKGLQQGLEKGLEKGKLEEALSIALEMKKDGIPVEQIAKFTKLSIEEIEKL